ncbi:MAG: phosphatase [Bacteroidales bacterium]|nr:phosphatase [Bacteroidales bacterium]
MKALADLHTHTVASGHGYSTLQEMARAAAEKGIEILGVTEHGPAVPGACDSLYFKNMIVIPRVMYGVRLLLGAEINILDTSGKLDMSDDECRMLDLRIAGIHSVCWKGGTAEENTEGVLNVMRNPLIHIISHPGDGTAELCFEPLVLESANSHTLLEINSHSLHPARHKTAARDNNIAILKLCKKHGVPVILGSDAHISFSVGCYDYVLPLLNETGFPEELIMNDKPELLMEWLGIRV